MDGRDYGRKARKATRRPGVGCRSTGFYCGRAGLAVLGARARHEPTDSSHRLATVPEPSLAAESEYFSDGFTMELIDSLSKVEKLRVVSWNSAVRFRGKANELKELRGQLQAGAVLDGSLRKQGDRVVIDAKLVDTTGGETIWYGTYDRPSRDIFQIQEEIAKSIVYGLKVQLRVDPQRILVPPRTESAPAYDDYLHARSFRGQLSRASLQKSSEYAEKALSEDGKYSPAAALLASNLALFGG